MGGAPAAGLGLSALAGEPPDQARFVEVIGQAEPGPSVTRTQRVPE
jgi:hypothetical protein